MNGSGVCLNLVDIVRVADFSTQIVNNPSAVATYTGKGGNRFAFTLPKLDGIFSGNGVFNLASQRLFVIDAAGLQRYSLNITVHRIDGSVDCNVTSVALTVLFMPN